MLTQGAIALMRQRGLTIKTFSISIKYFTVVMVSLLQLQPIIDRFKKPEIIS
jgi:hypothetical protein